MALTYLARQGHGRAVPADEHEALLGAVRFRRGLLGERKAAQQRLHDQVNGLCPGLSAPVGQGRKLDLSGVAGQAFLDCLVDFGGRPAAARSLHARATGRLTTTDAQYWAQRWKDCLPAPADAAVRVERLARSVCRWRQLSADITAVETDMARLLALTDGQILTTLPGVKHVRAACFSAFTLPITRFPTAEHLYSATGLAPASYQSSSIDRRGGISRQGLPEHRDALMGIAWGLSQNCPPFTEREEQLRTRGMRPMQARVALARHACRLVYRMLTTQDAYDEQRYRRERHQTGRCRRCSYAARRRNLACRPPGLGPPTAKTRARRTTAPNQPADSAPPPPSTHTPVLPVTPPTSRADAARPHDALTRAVRARAR